MLRGHVGGARSRAARRSSPPRAAPRGRGACVLMWITRSMPVGRQRGRSRSRRCASGLAASPSSRLLVSMREDDRDRHQQQPDARRAGDVEVAVAGEHWTARRRAARSTRPISAAKSSSRITGSSGDLARRMNCTQRAPPAGLVGLPDRGAEGEALHHDRAEQHDDRDPPPAAVEQLVGLPVVDLVRTCGRPRRARTGRRREQHDRDQERVDVALAAEAERVLRRWPRARSACRRAAAGPGCRSRRPSGCPRRASRTRR